MNLSGKTFIDIERKCLRLNESKIILVVESNKLNDTSSNFQLCFPSKVTKSALSHVKELWCEHSHLFSFQKMRKG